MLSGSPKQVNAGVPDGWATALRHRKVQAGNNNRGASTNSWLVGLLEIHPVRNQAVARSSGNWIPQKLRAGYRISRPNS